MYEYAYITLTKKFTLEAPVLRVSLRGLSSEAPKPPAATEAAETSGEAESLEASAEVAPSIPEYISAATPTDPADPVGPGALKSGNYQNTEYYCYNKMSYFDLEMEMASQRIPQPSADNGQF
ncbi:uncharacterized protein NdufV3 isoform X1 [Panulirus ornatus]|uniref:uncharacterized protein NdufV3 isoform X1 n=1 Tax=Panulirus ornatus TaxID=150431 RepID=UPI003A8570B5